MASLYKRPRSPFWWCQFRDPVSGRLRRKSTRFRYDNPQDCRRAAAFRAEREAEELRTCVNNDEMQWHKWVIPWLNQKHAASPKTLKRYLTQWRGLSAYLDHVKVASPAELTRKHCIDFMAWRKGLGSFRGSKPHPVAHNTALMDLKFLGHVMYEAGKRDWIKGNVASKLGIARELPREKAELADGDVALIRSAIAKRQAQAGTDDERRNAEFLRVSFEIALHQGCRMFETHLALADVDLEHREITFLAKGRKRFTAPLSPGLLPLFRELIKRGQEFTYEQPRMPSLVWFKFLEPLRLKHPHLRRVSFHSTRVTVVSRLGRAGVPERVAMALVNHSSTTMHRLYRRVSRSELPAVWKALEPLRGAGRGKRSSGGNRGARPST